MPHTLWILTLPISVMCLIGELPLSCKFIKSPLLVDNAVDLFCYTEILEYSYSPADIVHNIIKILFLQMFEVSLAFVHLFAIYKHRSVKI